MAKSTKGARGRGLQPLPRPRQCPRHCLLGAAHLLPAALPHRVVGAGRPPTVAACLQGRLPEGDVLEEGVVAAVVVLVGRIADVLTKQVARLGVAWNRAVKLSH